MPDREDEYWASEKEEDLRFCYKHKHYFKPEFGCQECFVEKSKEVISLTITHEKIELVKCPNCLKVSLSWFIQTNSYDCMNPKCRHTYTKQQYEEEIKIRDSEPKGKAWFGNSYFDSKRNKWRKSEY